MRMDKEEQKKRQKERQKADYYYYKNNHICVQCRKNSAVKGQVYCYDCREYRRKKSKKYRLKRNNGTDQRQKKNYEKWVSEKKAAGLCIWCGKNPAINGKNLCGVCNARKNAKQRRKYRETHPNYITPDMRRSGNYCYRCGIPLTEENRHNKLCLKCYEKARESMKKATEKLKENRLKRRKKNECK